MSLSLISKGIEAVMNDVLKRVDQDPEVILANEAVDSGLSMLNSILNDKAIGLMEECINAARVADTCAAYRLGVTEGLRLANEVRALIGSASGGEA